MDEHGIEQRFDRIDEKLDNINSTLGRMAIQEEQIKTLREVQDMLIRKYDKLSSDINALEKFQASCPRKDIKERFEVVKDRFTWVWVFLVPMAGSLLVMSYNLFVVTVNR